MADLYQTTLNLSSGMFHLSGVSPGTVEQTIQQAKGTGYGLPGISMQGVAGFTGILPGSYDVYRRMSAHPTIALVMGMVKAPIVGNSWKWSKRDPAVKDEWLHLVQTTMDPLRNTIVRDALKALEYGWAPFEKIWEVRNGYQVLSRLKPLNWDYTEVLVDEHGNVGGLVNQPPGQPKVNLLKRKYFIYCCDGEAGNPYGRSRHENVRKEWCEAEQIRQRMAQYMRKIAGIVVQLHYPEGTSKDQAGADRPNQWLAQEVLDAVSQGKSVMFPNGFADTTDIRMAYELAGKSQWNLSSFDPGHGDFAPGMKTILEYYDALLFRGWLRPERAGLESKHGSRADAQVHTDTGTLDCELIDRDLTDAINHGIVDDLLMLNFGKEAKGAVYATPAPIENDSVDIYKTLVNTLLMNKETGPAVAKKIDIDGILDSLNVPVEQKQRGSLADEIKAETPPTDGAAAPGAGGQVLPLGYNPNQPRDTAGKWTSNGSAVTPSSAVNPGSAGNTNGASTTRPTTQPATQPSTKPAYAPIKLTQTQIDAIKALNNVVNGSGKEHDYVKELADEQNSSDPFDVKMARMNAIWDAFNVHIIFQDLFNKLTSPMTQLVTADDLRNVCEMTLIEVMARGGDLPVLSEFVDKVNELAKTMGSEEEAAYIAEGAETQIATKVEELMKGTTNPKTLEEAEALLDKLKNLRGGAKGMYNMGEIEKGTVNVEQSAIDYAKKSTKEAENLEKLQTTANNLSVQGYHVRVLGEDPTLPGELAIKKVGSTTEVPAQSKLLDGLSNNTVNSNLREATKQAGNGGTSVIDGSKVGLTREKFEEGFKQFQYNIRVRASAGYRGESGTVIVIFGDGTTAVKTFP